MLYAFCGLTGGLLHLLFSYYAVSHGLYDSPTLGASGAIMGMAVVAAANLSTIS